MPPTHISNLLRLSEDAQALWRPDEMPELFEHLLSAPLELERKPDTTEKPREYGQATNAIGSPRITFGGLLHERTTNLDLFMSAKEFAKRERSNSSSLLPKPVATVLYFAIIAAAIEQHGKRITELGDKELKDGLRWSEAQPWLDQKTSRLLRACLAKLSARQM